MGVSPRDRGTKLVRRASRRGPEFRSFGFSYPPYSPATTGAGNATLWRIMRYHRRRLRLPFVVTFAGATAFGCSTESANSKSSGGAGGSGGASDAGGLDGASGGVGGAGDAATQCPPTLSNDVGCSADVENCEYTVQCQGGPQTFSIWCKKGLDGWQLSPKDCDASKLYDSCPGTEVYCDENGKWVLRGGLNPPVPCPATPKADGEMCFDGEERGYTSPCGYPCAPLGKSGWMVTECVAGPDAGLVWQTSVACQ